MKLNIKNNELIFKGETVLLDELQSENFFKYSNSVADDYYNQSWYVNELYINFIQSYKSLEFFVKTNFIKEIDVVQSNPSLFFYLKDLALNTEIKIIGSQKFEMFKSKMRFHLEMILSSFYLMFLMLKIKHVKTSIENESLSITRTPAARGKISALDIYMEFEDPKMQQSLYRVFKRSTRFIWCIKALFSSYRQYKNLKKLMVNYIGPNSLYYLRGLYGSRLVHTNLYYYLMKEFLNEVSLKTFYTGNNLDRFAMIEEQIAKEKGIQLVNIPHGLEYGFKFPKCFTGDVFYATSESAAIYLNKMYQTNKFIFDQPTMEKIFKLKYDQEDKDQKIRIVYFSEPREAFVNHQIIEEILPLFKESNLSLSLKLHPKDAVKDYQKYELEILTDFGESISQNICFARKSTTLLEAIYNESSSAAILINDKDKAIFNTFPSLQTAEIKQCLSIKELVEWIGIEYNNKLVEGGK